MLTADYSVLFSPSPWSFTCQLHLCMRTAGMWTMKLALQQYITIRQDFGAETKLIPQQLPVLGFPSTVMLYNSMLFPLPSCSILASVITLTFPPLHLPPSSSSVSSLPPLLTVALSLSLCRSPFQSLLRHTAAVLKIQLQSRCLSGLVGEGWLEVRQRQGVFGGSITGLSLSVWVERFSRGTLLQQKAIYTRVS